MENSFDIKVTGITTYVMRNCSSIASNLHGLIVWTHDSDRAYQVGNECKVEIIAMR